MGGKDKALERRGRTGKGQEGKRKHWKERLELERGRRERESTGKRG